MTSSRDLPNPGIKPTVPALQADSLPSESLGKPVCMCVCVYIYIYIKKKKHHGDTNLTSPPKNFRTPLVRSGVGHEGKVNNLRNVSSQPGNRSSGPITLQKLKPAVAGL